MELIMISRMTEVKNWLSTIPAFNPRCATISATSPRVIMPQPIFRESRLLKPREHFSKHADNHEGS